MFGLELSSGAGTGCWLLVGGCCKGKASARMALAVGTGAYARIADLTPQPLLRFHRPPTTDP